MQPWVQEALVAVIVAAAVLFLVRKVLGPRRRPTAEAPDVPLSRLRKRR